jgi:putative lipase involved disintegration of autophagic bodies
MMRILLPLICLLFLASCSPRFTQTTKTVEKDSVHVDTVKTQRIVKIKGDSVGMAFRLPDVKGEIIYPAKSAPPEKQFDSTFPSEDPIVFQKTQKEGRLTESVTISKKGNVTISCKEDSLKEIIEAQRITIQKFKDVTTTKTNTIVCPPKTDWEKLCEWWTWLCIAALIGATVYRFRKAIPWLSWIP